MCREDCIAEADQQLSDKQYYQQLNADPTEALLTEIAESIVQMAEWGYIDTTTKQFLVPVDKDLAASTCSQKSTYR